MSIRSGRRWLSAALACFILAGVITSVTVLGQSSASGQQQGQLSALISAAESSRAYAYSTVNSAASNGLSVSASQAQLSQGDSLLATAKADAQSGTNLAAGIQAVQSAMSDYAGAASSSSLALSNAGLVASVDYYAAAAAVAEVNASVNVVASVASRACAIVGASAPNAQAFTQACTQVSAQLTSARTNLHEAANLLVQTGGHVAASADLSQALSLVAKARSEVASCQSELLTIASYTYSQRGQAYVTSVVNPLSAGANATIRNEASVIADLTAFQTIWSTYSQSQANAVSSVGSSAASLATAITQVNTGAVTSSTTSAQNTEGQLYSDLQVLLTLPAITALPGVVTDINSALAAATTYNNALVSVNNWIGSFSQTQISSYGAYLGTWNGDSMSAQNAGTSYLSAYQTVVNDLSVPLLQGLPQVQAVLSLPVGQTVSAANASMNQATTAMGTVQADITSLTTAVSSAQSAVPVPSGTLSTAASISTEGAAYLNSSAASAMARIATSVQATAQTAQSFVASAQACLLASVGTYASSVTSLDASGASLSTQTQSSTTATATAISYVTSDSNIRTTEASTGRADVARALNLFASQNIGAGIAAMAQACLEFQAASGTSVSL